MILFLFIILLSAGVTYGLTFVLSWPLYGLIPFSFIITLITFLLFVMFILLPIFSVTSPKGKFKHFIFRQVSQIIFFVTKTPYKVEGLENLAPVSNEPLVIVANHKSNLDGVWLHTILKRPLTAIGKQELKNNFLYNKIIKSYKVVTINRENNREAAKSISEGVKLVANGLPIIVFTEGGIKTRETDQMVCVRPGAYKIAYKAEANIQPMAIHNSNTIKGKGFFKKNKVTIKILPVIKYEDYKEKNTIELGLEIAEKINNTFVGEKVKVEVL